MFRHPLCFGIRAADHRQHSGNGFGPHFRSGAECDCDRGHVETGLARTATTNRAGNFLLLELPVGHYQLEVSASGFQKYLQEGVSLDVNEIATVPIHLSRTTIRYGRTEHRGRAGIRKLGFLGVQKYSDR
jgi:hypothetical protein